MFQDLKSPNFEAANPGWARDKSASAVFPVLYQVPLGSIEGAGWSRLTRNMEGAQMLWHKLRHHCVAALHGAKFQAAGALALMAFEFLVWCFEFTTLMAALEHKVSSCDELLHSPVPSRREVIHTPALGAQINVCLAHGTNVVAILALEDVREPPDLIADGTFNHCRKKSYGVQSHDQNSFSPPLLSSLSLFHEMQADSEGSRLCLASALKHLKRMNY